MLEKLQVKLLGRFVYNSKLWRHLVCLHWYQGYVTMLQDYPKTQYFLISNKWLNKFKIQINLNINLACLGVCLCPINVKTAELIGPKFFGGPSSDPRKGLWMIKFSKICLHQNSIFKNFENLRIFFLNPQNLLLFLFYNVYKKKMFTIERKDRREAP